VSNKSEDASSPPLSTQTTLCSLLCFREQQSSKKDAFFCGGVMNLAPILCRVVSKFKRMEFSFSYLARKKRLRQPTESREHQYSLPDKGPVGCLLHNNLVMYTGQAHFCCRNRIFGGGAGWLEEGKRVLKAGSQRMTSCTNYGSVECLDNFKFSARTGIIVEQEVCCLAHLLCSFLRDLCKFKVNKIGRLQVCM